MKKAKILLGAICCLLVLSLPVGSYSAADSQDQSDGCAAPTGGDLLSDVTKFPMYQVFAPTMNKLTKVRILFGGTNTPVITLTIKDMGGNSLGNVNSIVSAGWIDFNYASPITLTPGLSYQISLARESTANVYWNYCQPGGYGGGYAVTGGTIIPDKDYNFQTFGYNQATSTPTAPLSAIEPPQNLKAEDVPDDTGGKIKLSWEKSATRTIDGYRLFRKPESETEYKKVVDLDYKNLEYEDSGLENGTTYIYKIRAYEGTNESADSNQVSAAPENNLAPKEPSGLRVTAKGKDFIEISWDKVDDERLDKYIIRYGTSPTDFLKEIEVGKEETVYRFSNLKSGTRYYFRVASRGSDGETSDFSDFVSEETLSEEEGISWVWILSLVILFLLLLGLYLYFAYRKHWWPFGKRNLKSQIPNPKQIPNQNIQNGKTDDDIKELSGKKGKW